MTLNEPSDPITALVSDFAHRRVLVLGDAMLDEYLLGDCGRISPEAPVPVLKVDTCRRALGGAANTAANVVALGGRATLVACVGRDDTGLALTKCASDAGIDLLPIDHGISTIRKTRVIGQRQQIVRLDYEETRVRPAALDGEILARIDCCLADCDIVVVSDYAKGFLSPSLAQAIMDRAHAAGRRVIIDPRPQNRHCYHGCDYLTPNWREARALVGLGDAKPSEADVAPFAQTLASELGTNVVLTLGAHGIAFCSRNGTEQFWLPTVAREVFDVSGAGDTVVASFALARAAGADHPAAVALANKAASVVVGKFGTATVSPAEILQDTDALRLLPRNALAPLATTLRAKGKRIVTLNGTFDILHSGHLHILNEARKRGDVLIVGINSDRSVRACKGRNRPLVPEQRRAEMLLALRMVDYVHIFDEPDPIALLTEIRPDVHVNGAEYGEQCIESDTVRRNGGELHIVDRIRGLSTSHLIDILESSATPQ